MPDDAGQRERLLALDKAVKNSDFSAIERLLAEGADLLKRDCYGRSALQNAAINGRPKSVSLLAKALPAARASEALSNALVEAAARGHWRCVNALLSAGADPDAIDPQPSTHGGRGDSALALAAMSARINTVRALLAAGASPSLGNASGVTPLMRAAANPQHAGISYTAYSLDPKVEAGPDPDGEPNLGPEDKEKKRLECLRALIEAGAALDSRDAEGASAAMRSALTGDSEALLMLARAGADLAGCSEALAKARIDASSRARLGSLLEASELIGSTSLASKGQRRAGL